MKVMSSFTVRYSETDKMGVVHHSNYPIWFESGRREYFKKIGNLYSEIEEKGYMLPLTSMNCEFKKPAKYDDEVLVITSIKSITCARIEFEYEVLNNLLNYTYVYGETSHGWTDKEFKALNFKKLEPDIFENLKNSMNAKYLDMSITKN